MVTGFGKNARNILLALHQDPNIEVFEAENGVRFGTDLLTPWKSYGTLNQHPNVLQQIQGDGLKERYNSYGGYAIDEIVEDCKPDIYIGVEDIWAFPQYEEKPWWNKINKVLWTTLDSLPILDQARQMEPHCDKMLVWASFAEEEMKKLGHKTVQTVHGAVDYTNFKPLENRVKIREKFNLQDEYVIGYVFKNQLRKSVPNLVQGFKIFKEKNPEIKTKLLLHTAWGERGWDIPRYVEEMKIDPKDVLSTYVCHSCDFYHISPYQGEDKNCPRCKKEKSFKKLKPFLDSLIKHEPKELRDDVFKEFAGLKSATNEVFKNAKEFLFLGEEGQVQKNYPEYYQQYLRRLKETDVKEKVIIRGDFRGKIQKSKNSTFRYISKDLLSPTTTLIIGNKVLITIWEKPIHNILITSKKISDSYRGYFNQLWKISKN